MILIIDNYDSFTYNLAQMIEQMGHEVKVFRNNKIDIPQINILKPDGIVISPGPGVPADAGISVEVIKDLGPETPILGVCLGHQAVAEAFGGKIISAKKIMHGKTSSISHNGRSIFRRISSPFEAVRYHSLAVEKKTLPGCLEITAWTEDDEIMGLRHRSYPVEGVQFHPESILTEAGAELLRNFISGE
ncbi:MAG: aminodeoxychorismate/anthranilate synthase component II [Deltaproteobacteria bacterium]|nr:aminodeoxychorismate/anthranilate synthase component II [Deltaproteobacteria bacterium]